MYFPLILGMGGVRNRSTWGHPAYKNRQQIIVSGFCSAATYLSDIAYK